MPLTMLGAEWFAMIRAGSSKLQNTMAFSPWFTAPSTNSMVVEVLAFESWCRARVHQTPEVPSAVLALFLRALRSALRDASPGAPAAVRDAQLGPISFPQ